MTAHLLKTGTLIANRYEILNFHAQGGMQQVYKAKDLRFNRIVAVKIPKELSAEKRFEISAKASAKVNHPFVAKALDYIPDEHVDIFVEEFIIGGSLDEYFTQCFHYFDPHLATRFIQQIASGLAASHRVGVVHRDIKPANIMVTNQSNILNFKITDFGIAKLVEDEFSSHQSAQALTTNSSTFLGAIPYMAPEVIESTKKASFASDVWALGALLYHVVFGKYPFGYGPQAIAKIVNGEIPEFSIPFQNKKQFIPLVDELVFIIKKCLQRNPKDRPTADNLVTMLSSICFSSVLYEVDCAGRLGKAGNWLHTSQKDLFLHTDSYWGDFSKLNTGTPLYCGTYQGYNRVHPAVPLKSLQPFMAK